MVKTKATKEETLAKFKAAREKKRTCLANLEKSMKEAYKNVQVRRLKPFLHYETASFTKILHIR